MIKGSDALCGVEPLPCAGIDVRPDGIGVENPPRIDKGRRGQARIFEMVVEGGVLAESANLDAGGVRRETGKQALEDPRDGDASGRYR